MYALSFDLDIAKLKQVYGTPYNKAYFEIKKMLKKNGFEWVQGSTYIVEYNELTALIKVVMELSKLPWLKSCVRDIRGFKVENWSDFTELVKSA